MVLGCGPYHIGASAFFYSSGWSCHLKTFPITDSMTLKKSAFSIFFSSFSAASLHCLHHQAAVWSLTGVPSPASELWDKWARRQWWSTTTLRRSAPTSTSATASTLRNWRWNASWISATRRSARRSCVCVCVCGQWWSMCSIRCWLDAPASCHPCGFTKGWVMEVPVLTPHFNIVSAVSVHEN